MLQLWHSVMYFSPGFLSCLVTFSKKMYSSKLGQHLPPICRLKNEKKTNEKHHHPNQLQYLTCHNLGPRCCTNLNCRSITFAPNTISRIFWQRKSSNEDEATVYLDSGGPKYTVYIYIYIFFFSVHKIWEICILMHIASIIIPHYRILRCI